MTDNRTTELREKLTERGVKWVAWEKECHLTLEGFFETRWDANGVRWSYLEINGKATLSVVGRMEIELTPEQAIAATLGSGTLTADMNPDGLPVGLTISDDGNLLNWRGENYVKQTATLGADMNPDGLPVGLTISGDYDALLERLRGEAVKR